LTPLGKHIPALDGVRGLAILLVIAFHARVVFTTTNEIPYLGFRALGLGWSGVDLFFVLSGFLITGILLDSRGSPRYFRVFYLRRALRIFPLYFAYLFLILIVARFLLLAYTGSDLWNSTNPWWYFTYLLNWKSDQGYNDLVLGHLWSLAIEEQFYLVWPAMVWLAPRRHLKWLCLIIAAGAFLARFYMGSHGYGSEATYRMTPGRMDTLALGAFVAVGLRDFRAVLDRWANVVLALSTAGFLAVWAFNSGPVWSDLAMRTLGASLIAVVYSCLVFHAATLQKGTVCRFLSSTLLTRCGKYSYAMYVLHSVPYNLTADAIRNLSVQTLPLPLVIAAKYLYFPALAGVAFGAAWISWRVLEHPFIRLKDRAGDSRAIGTLRVECNPSFPARAAGLSSE
jgi:peptidoglycan/LPS O-acetylase OafA/YrhL